MIPTMMVCGALIALIAPAAGRLNAQAGWVTAAALMGVAAVVWGVAVAGTGDGSDGVRNALPGSVLAIFNELVGAAVVVAVAALVAMARRDRRRTS